MMLSLLLLSLPVIAIASLLYVVARLWDDGILKKQANGFFNVLWGVR